MQRSIASFFQPKGKTRDDDKKKEPVKKPAKSPLRVQNGVVEADSPIKKVAKRSRQIMDSDEDEAPVSKGVGDKEAASKPEKDDVFKAVPTPLSPPPAPATPVTPATPATPAQSASPGTPGTPNSTSPSEIVKRKTARKMFPKRKLDESRSGGSGGQKEEAEAKEEQGQRKKRPRVETTTATDGDPDEPMEEGAKAEEVEKAVTECDGRDEEVEENEKKEDGEEAKEAGNSSDEKEEKAEGAEKNNEAKEETDDEGESADAKKKKKKKKKEEEEEVVEKDTQVVEESPKRRTGKGEKDKEPAKKAPISSFFAPRKAAVKTEKNEGEKKTTSGERKSSAEESKDTKSESTPGQTDYDPARPGYHPVDHACWKQGQKVPYLAVARTFEKIEEDSGRLRNIETLSNLLRSVLLLSPDDLLCCVYLCLNQLGPAYLGMELGIGETLLMKAVAQATGRQLDKIKAEAQEKGDLGLVAESSRSNQRMMFQPASLTAGGVFRKLKEIASMSGNSAMNKKIDIIKGLFVACRFSEARYIVRSLAGKLRIGLAEQSVLSALSLAVCLTPPGQDFPPAVIDAGKGMSAESRRAWIEEKTLILKQTYCEMPNYDILIPVLVTEGIDQLPNHCKLTPGVPLRPMLAHPTKGVGEVLKKFDEAAFTCEYKYDGERAQIHILESGEVRIFSRNQEDNTSKYPDIISRIPKVKKDSVVSCVLDSEAVAWDLCVCVRYRDGTYSCEGLMVKTLEKDATYEIAKRSHNWLKLKKDYLEGVGDTMDLCVIGAYLGKGKRTGTYGGFLLACYDEENEEFQSVCKIGTGFKDEDLEQHYKYLKTNPACAVALCNEAHPVKVIDGELGRASGVAMLLRSQRCRLTALETGESIGSVLSPLGGAAL
ncbi:hypothetical protein F2P81_000327 [Scophthalmus maximus]|uniref:DNA ligase n=1 Tax=Scophthalmus maximus TaxID=52904 RepID=A0A6A4TU13_SCOMX|nr:hypothetical protein F2P81_000327 [Scophthalmus maximus]